MDDSGRRTLRHELRTPLNQIIGYSELLIEELRDASQDALVPDLEKIGVAARTMLQLIDGLFKDGTLGAPSPRHADDPTMGPAPEPAAKPSASPRRITAEGPMLSDASGRRILVVDDDPRNVEFLARQLERRGFLVDVASSGPEALDRIRRVPPPDLVLLDVMMPGMSGTDVLRIVRDDYPAADLPIIMATALDQSGDVVEALRLGANDYVTKPLDLPVVLARLENQLALKSAREQIQRLAQDLESRNRLIRSTFGRFLDDEVVNALLETPEGLKLGGTRKTVTVLMSDLRGFTAMADRLSPDEVMAILNDYLGAMVEVIDRHRGTIIEFIGDAVLVLFGAPLSRDDDARRAVACAIEMQRAMGAVNARLQERGLSPLEMGIALNTGEVIAGNIGSLKRSKYGVVGRHINLAARIESYAVGGQILAARSTVDAAGDDVQVAERTTVNAKGFAEPIDVMELRGLAKSGLAVPESTELLVDLTQPLPVRVTIVEGKFLSDREHEGTLVRLGPSLAVLSMPIELRSFTDVRLRVGTGAGAFLDEDVYAKVLRSEVSGKTVRLRFTSVAPKAAAIFRSAIPQTR